MPTIDEALQIAMHHHQAGRLSDAEQIYRQILAVNANNITAHNNLIRILVDTHQYKATIQAICEKITYHPLNIEYVDIIAIAIEKNEGVLVLNGEPDKLTSLACALNDYGNTLQDQGKYINAITCYHAAVELCPEFAAAYNNLGNAYQSIYKLEDAISSYRRAIILQPECADVHNNLGAALNRIGNQSEAVFHCRRAVTLSPDNADANNNLCAALADMGHFDEAIKYCRSALELAPGYAEARFNQATLNLRKGVFEQGWIDFESRWEAQSLNLKRTVYIQPEWEGDFEPGKTLLVEAEQGLGDSLQFVRYLPLIKENGMKVLFRCPNPLIRLLINSKVCDQLLNEDTILLPTFDFHIPLLSLPKLFKTSMNSIPATVSYLSGDESLIAKWKDRLKSIVKLRVGINYRGRSDNYYQCKRNLPIDLISQLATMPGIQLISLQKGLKTPEETRMLQTSQIISFDDQLDTTNGPFMDTAAIMKNLDLVITSDTSIAHLAGALGVPVWVALPYVPDWRWLLDREDSPWYPTMRLFRQKKRGDWGIVFENITSKLLNFKGDPKDAG